MHDINLVISSLRGGGAERAAVELCNGWVEQGLSVLLTTLSSGEDDDYQLDSAVKRIPLEVESESVTALSGLLTNVNRIRSLRKVLRSMPAKHVIGFSSTSNILVILASMGLKQKKLDSKGQAHKAYAQHVVVSERNYPPRSMRSQLWQQLRRHLYRFADDVVVQTQAGAEWLHNNTSAKKITVIPNSINLPISSGLPIIKTSDLVPDDKCLMFAVGNMHRQKGFDLLIDAAMRSNLRSSDWLLVIAGAGDASWLQDLIKERGLDDHVVVAGRVGNIADWYDRADVFVLSSRYEGFPNVLLEAMASGCAVVSFDCMTGPADIIEHETNGLLVQAENSKALAESMNEVMSNEQLRKKMGINAALVTQQFSTDRLFANWSEVLAKDGLR